VTRIDPRTRRTTEITVGRSPQGIDTGKDSVWVANALDGTLSRIDARTRRVVGRPVKVGDQPFAVSVRGRTVWATLLAGAAIARVDVAPRD
jgi:YVTN family beta-propeller protein